MESDDTTATRRCHEILQATTPDLGETVNALIVDDSATLRKLMRGVLESLKFDPILEAENGKLALAAVEAQSGKIDLVLCDWNMPEMTGIEFVRAMKPTHPQVPIIMVTTESEKARVIEAIKSGAKNFVIKPFENAVLADKIKKVLGL
jgi:two-component system chemotaxis response regulator CheY